MAEKDIQIRTLPLLPLKNSVLFPGSVDAAVGGACRARLRRWRRRSRPKKRDHRGGAARRFGRYAGRERSVHHRHARGDPQRRGARKIRSKCWCYGLERVVIVKVDDESGHMAARVRALPAAGRFQPRNGSADAVDRRDGHEVRGADAVAEPDAAGTGADVHVAGRSAAAGLHDRVDHEPGSGRGSRRCWKRRRASKRCGMVHGWLSHEVEVLELRNKITEEARGEMSREQREYILRQQKRAIEQELGEKNPRPGRSRVDCARSWRRPICRKMSARKPSASWRGWRSCRRRSRSTT